MSPRTRVFRCGILVALLALVLPSSGRMPIVAATGYTISGRVTDRVGNPVQGVTITVQAELQHRLYLPVVMQGYDQGIVSETNFGLLRPKHRAGVAGDTAPATYTAVTDADGNYALNGLPAGVYVLVLSQAGQVFSPPSRTVTVPPDASGQDFVANGLPNIPSNPSPTDGAVDRSIGVDLGWTGGDPDGDAVTYDVYLEAGDATPDALVCNDAVSASCDPSPLEHSTQYHWRVIARDAHGAIANGPVWSFTTSALGESALFDSVLYMAADTGYALVGDNASLDLGVGDGEDFTIEAFFFVPDLEYDDFYTDILARKRDSFSFYISFNADQHDWILFEITTAGGGNVKLSYSSNLQVGWHHVAASYDNEYTETEDALAIFLDGTRVAYSPDDISHVDWTPGIPNSSQPLEVGGVVGGRAGFNGYLEEIRVSDVIRYSGATYSVPTEPFGTDANTAALWHFDEIAGSTSFGDASSYGNDLTGYLGAQTYNP